MLIRDYTNNVHKEIILCTKGKKQSVLRDIRGSAGLCVIAEISTCANKEHVVRLFPQLDPVNRDLRVANVAFQQEGLAADHAVHQEVVFDKVQHLVRHVQRGGDALFPGSIGDALQKQSNKFFFLVTHVGQCHNFKPTVT